MGIKKFLLKIFIFHNLKNLCVLHGQVFIMCMLTLQVETVCSELLFHQTSKELGMIRLHMHRLHVAMTGFLVTTQTYESTLTTIKHKSGLLQRSVIEK